MPNRIKIVAPDRQRSADEYADSSGRGTPRFSPRPLVFLIPHGTARHPKPQLQPDWLGDIEEFAEPTLAELLDVELLNRRLAEISEMRQSIDHLSARVRLIEVSVARLGVRRASSLIGKSWLPKAEEELLAIGEGSYGHSDDDGSPSVSPRAWQVARRLITLLAPEWPKPDIGVGRKGQITLDWWGPLNHTLTVEVHGDGRLVYAALFGEFDNHGTEDLVETDDHPPAVIELALARVVRPEVPLGTDR